MREAPAILSNTVNCNAPSDIWHGIFFIPGERFTCWYDQQPEQGIELNPISSVGLSICSHLSQPSCTHWRRYIFVIHVVKESESESESFLVVCNSLQPNGLFMEFSRPESEGVGSLSLLQGIFPTQEWNRGLPHCRQILYHLNY